MIKDAPGPRVGSTRQPGDGFNAGDYEQVRAEGSDVRLLLLKRHLPDAVT